MAWALLRGLGLDRLGHPLVALVAFTPYVAATAPLPVVAALVLRRRAVAAVALAAALVLAGAVLPRALGGLLGVGAAAGPRLTVMTANLYVGAADPAAVVRLVRERDVDVLSLQELTPQALRRLDAAGLRRTMPHRSLAVGGPFGTNGSAVLSRRPLTAIPDADGALPAQPAAVVALLGGPRVRVQAVHPPPPISGDAVRRWRAALAELPAAGDPEVADVLAGDFNATLDHRELRAVLGRGYRDAAAALGAGLRPTWPAGRRLGRLTIDHVLADRRITPRALTVHTLPGTDHRAVVAVLDLPS